MPHRAAQQSDNLKVQLALIFVVLHSEWENEHPS